MDINYQLLDSICASIYWKNLEGVYLGCNKYMLLMSGLKNRNDLIGKTDFDLPWRSQANKIREIDEIVVRSGRTYELEENPVIHGELVRTFLSSKTPLIGEDNLIIGIIGVSIDVTEKKRVEEILRDTEKSLDESETTRERFLRNISHEIRNPLQGFVSTVETLYEKWDKLTEEQRYDSIKLVAQSSKRLSTLVINTFDLSDMMLNNVKLNCTNSSLTDLVVESAQEINLTNLGRNRSKIVVSTSTQYELFFDREKIKRVIDNLLMNAIKWSASENTVTVELHKGLLPNSYLSGVRCCIKDRGIKIPKNELEFIFEPFAESTNTASKASGIGLGLALCKEIIKIHSGEIWAENNIEQGVTFNFMIPIFYEEDLK